jgi:DNA adenine methylase
LKGYYFEPFVGGASMFVALQPDRAILSDANQYLICSLRAIRSSPAKIAAAISRLKNTRECYDRIRGGQPATAIAAGARFLYLNRTCWGGIQRFNRQGVFNVPFGNSGRPICRRDQIFEFAELLRAADLQVGDFETRINSAMEGDVVYADPPYTTLGANNGFVRYNEHLFSWADQQRLATAAKRARARGAFVAVSALWHSEILMLYRGWWAVKFKRIVCVSREAYARREVSEAVLFSRKPKSSAGFRLVLL